VKAGHGHFGHLAGLRAFDLVKLLEAQRRDQVVQQLGNLTLVGAVALPDR
jgi:hypothetical protein